MLKSPSLRVAVIGAGPSGLVAIKELLDEDHRPVGFEKRAAKGGNFNYPFGAAYSQMSLTVSQYFMAFSSFPPPMDEERRLWQREQYRDYLERFAARFALDDHIHYETNVVKLSRDGDEFCVVTESRGQRATHRFDAVAICAGAHSIDRPRMPRFPGAETFSGELLHSAAYKSPDSFRGKRVVCVGFGETAADIATQISGVADATWICFRKYPMLVSGESGPSDRGSARMLHWLAREDINELMLRRARETLASGDTASPNQQFCASWTLKCGTPAHQFLQKNDIIIRPIQSGQLKVIDAGVRELDGDSVVFEDGRRVAADVVVCCTGYEENTPPRYFEGVDLSNVRKLYKHVFHPDLGARVAFIGWARPSQGGVPACSEMQSRYFALLCSGKRQLPSRGRLLSLIARDAETEERQFFVQSHRKTLCCYTTYMDEMARLIGCRPPWHKLLRRPALLYRILFGTNFAATYRLAGPHAQADLATRMIMRFPAVPLSRAYDLSKNLLRSRVGSMRKAWYLSN